MRKLIAAMKMSLDAKIEGPEGYADWVTEWADEYGLTSQIDACLLGTGMYPNYEAYWTGVQEKPLSPSEMTGKVPTEGERRWAEFAAKTPHYVLSNSLSSARWPTTRFLRGYDDVAALKQEPGKDIYLMGGARVTAGLIDQGLVDELRLILYPLIVGEGMPLFATIERRIGLELKSVETISEDRLSCVYRLGQIQD